MGIEKIEEKNFKEKGEKEESEDEGKHKVDVIEIGNISPKVKSENDKQVEKSNPWAEVGMTKEVVTKNKEGDLIINKIEKVLENSMKDPSDRVQSRLGINQGNRIAEHEDKQGKPKKVNTIEIVCAKSKEDVLNSALLKEKQLSKKLEKEVNSSTKEVRKMRRHVVKLNTELDAAEREMNAQRTELERAADRMEKDRKRYKEEKEQLEKQCREEI